MKKILPLLLLIVCCFLQSCEKEAILTIGSSSLSFDKEGGKETVSMVANKAWSASSNQAWCKVSPNVGDGSKDSNFTLSISCDANQSYDERTCQITIKCEDKSAVITVNQSEGKGVIISQTGFSVSNEKQSISIDIQSNIDYIVIVDESSKQWIDAVVTKGLSPSKITLNILENESNSRVGSVTIKAEGISGSIITVNQDAVPHIVFEDKNFENACISLCDKNKDGLVSYKEALLVKEMVLDTPFMDEKISSLSEIKYFSNLTLLKCLSQPLKTLDVSGMSSLTELVCQFCELTNLDVSGCISLTSLNCRANELSSLDVSSCTNLNHLDCGGNQLTSLDVSGFTNLSYLDCGGNNVLTSLDVSGCTNLSILYCGGNQLANLDISSCSKLTTLSCNHNQLTTLDVSGLTALETLVCSENDELTSLNLSSCTSLTELWCHRNHLTSLDISECATNMKIVQCLSAPYLKVIWLKRNQTISSFRYDANVATIKYKDDYAEGIPIEDANFKAYLLTNFDKDRDGILSIKEAEAIKILYVGELGITSLRGIEDMPNLQELYCTSNKLTNLDFSNNTALTYLFCDFNQLTHLDVSNNTALTILSCSANQLTSLDVSNNTTLFQLNCGNNQLTSLDVSNNKALKLLACVDNQLTSLDVSNNTALNDLACTDNPLTNLDVSKNTALTYLHCSINQLKSLDVSKNTALTHLFCSYNQLKSLDVSSCTNLSYLDCANNPYLKEIWLRNNQTISTFMYDTGVATIKYK